MPLPRIEIIDQQGVVVAPIVRNHRLLALPDDVQLLIGSNPEPGPRKRESRPRNRFKSQHIAIKRHAPLDIGNMNGDVVELGDVHSQESSGFRGQTSENPVWWIVETPTTAGICLTITNRAVRMKPIRENLP